MYSIKGTYIIFPIWKWFINDSKSYENIRFYESISDLLRFLTPYGYMDRCVRPMAGSNTNHEFSPINNTLSNIEYFSSRNANRKYTERIRKYKIYNFFVGFLPHHHWWVAAGGFRVSLVKISLGHPENLIEASRQKTNIISIFFHFPERENINGEITYTLYDVRVIRMWDEHIMTFTLRFQCEEKSKGLFYYFTRILIYCIFIINCSWV